MFASARLGSFTSLLAIGVALVGTGSGLAKAPKPPPPKPPQVVKPTIVRPTMHRPTMTRPVIGTIVQRNPTYVPVLYPIPVMPFPMYNPTGYFRPMFPQMNPLQMYAIYSMMNNPIDGFMMGSMGGSFYGGSPGTTGLTGLGQ
jgi:hypothetical protein